MSRNIPLLKCYNFCEDCRLYAAFVILYFADVSGSYAAAMGVFSLGFLSQVISEVPTGVLSDKILGRKKTLIAAAVCDFIAIACYAAASNVFMLAAGAVFEGVSRAFTSGTDTAFLYETLKEEHREKEFDVIQGKTAAMFQLALFTGAVIGAGAVFLSYRLTVTLTLIPKALQIIVACFFKEPAQTRQNKENASIKNAFRLFAHDKKLVLFACADAVDFAFSEARYQFKATFLRLLIPDWAVSLFYAANNLMASAGFWFSGAIIRFFGHFKTFFGINLVSFLTTLCGFVLNNMLSPFLLISTSLGYGALSTAAQTVYQSRFSDTERATCASFVSLSGSLLLCIAATGMGALADATSPFVALIVATVAPQFITLPVYWGLFRPGN